MRPTLALVLCLCMLVDFGCEDDDDALARPGPLPLTAYRSYACTCFDSAGTVARADLWLFLKYTLEDGDTLVAGTWVLPHPESTDSTIAYFQLVTHENLSGSVRNRRLSLNLAPGWGDAGILLHGTFDNDLYGSFTGQWEEVDFVGSYPRGPARAHLLRLCPAGPGWHMPARPERDPCTSLTSEPPPCTLDLPKVNDTVEQRVLLGLEVLRTGGGGAVQSGITQGSRAGCSPWFSFCVFAASKSQAGAAIASWGANPVKFNCTITRHTATST